MISMWRFFTCAAAALFIACTGGEEIAGSKGGSETTNGVTACILKSDGSVARGSRVRLRKNDYVSRLDNVIKKSESRDAVTDSDGRFIFPNIDPGSYCIEVFDSSEASGRSAAIFRCTVGKKDTLNLGTGKLEKCAFVRGRSALQSTSAQKYYAQIRGLERIRQIDSDGGFVFDNIPGGLFDLLIVKDTNAPVNEILDVSAFPGDTVSVIAPINSTYSGNVYINTTSKGMSLAEMVTDFPLALRLDSATFDFRQARGDGADIRLTKDNGTALPYEIEEWDSVSQKAVIWVKIDTIYADNATQHIVMNWGNSLASDSSMGERVFDTACGFAGVWHLNENPQNGTGRIIDRTSNGYSAIPSSSMNSGNVVNGVTGRALSFNGLNDSIDAGQLNLDGKYSMSLWIYARYLENKSRRFIWKDSSYTLWYDATGYGLRAEHFTDSLVWRGIYQDNSSFYQLDTAKWYHLYATYDEDKIRLFVNGVQIDSTKTLAGRLYSGSASLCIGGRSDEFVNGIIDEVRIERKARSASWIRLCYTSQKHGGISPDFRRR